MTTKHEASRNFIWQVAASILETLAHRNMSTERMEVVLGWPTRRLTAFLASAVFDTLSESDTLTLRELSDLFWELDIEVRIALRHMPDDPIAPPETEI